MNEMPKKFTIERGENSEQSMLEKEIDALYAQASESKNLEAFDDLYANVATFCEELVKNFSKEELTQVSAYHRLIRSGVPKDSILHSAQKGELSLQRKREIEEMIAAFTVAQIDILNDHDSF